MPHLPNIAGLRLRRGRDRIKEGGNERNLRDTKAFAVHLVLQFSHCKAFGQLPKPLLVHPLGAVRGFRQWTSWWCVPSCWSQPERG